MQITVKAKSVMKKNQYNLISFIKPISPAPKRALMFKAGYTLNYLILKQVKLGLLTHLTLRQ